MSNFSAGIKRVITLFATTILLSACSPSPESGGTTDKGTSMTPPATLVAPKSGNAIDKGTFRDSPPPKSVVVTEDFYGDFSFSEPERVAKNVLEATLKGNFEEALLKYGKRKDRAVMECIVVRQCSEEEFKATLKAAGFTEKEVLDGLKEMAMLMTFSDRSFEEIMLSLKRAHRHAGEHIASEMQKRTGGIESISTRLVSQTEDAAVVAATIKFRNSDVRQQAQVTLVKEDGEWKK